MPARQPSVDAGFSGICPQTPWIRGLPGRLSSDSDQRWTDRCPPRPVLQPSNHAPFRANGPHMPSTLGLQTIDCKGYSTRFPFPVSRFPLPAVRDGRALVW